MQVEFNKAAQSLTEAVLPSTQKKTALNRLLQVHIAFGFYLLKSFISPLSITLKRRLAHHFLPFHSCLQDNVALIAVLEAKFSNHGADPGKRQLLCVVRN